MTAFTTRVAAALAALVTAFAVSSCSQPAQDAHDDGHEGHETSATDGAAAFNDADIAFVTNMIPHHEQAVKLTELAPGRANSPMVGQLATQIYAEQKPEIDTLRGLLTQWGQDPDAHSDHEGMAMAGMVDDATMTKLESLTGQEFDTLWLQSMLAHHEGAIDMANTEVSNGENVDAIALAKTIIGAQQSEITQIKEILGA